MVELFYYFIEYMSIKEKLLLNYYVIILFCLKNSAWIIKMDFTKSKQNSWMINKEIMFEIKQMPVFILKINLTCITYKPS